jgi:hypothetical protein
MASTRATPRPVRLPRCVKFSGRMSEVGQNQPSPATGRRGGFTPESGLGAGVMALRAIAAALDERGISTPRGVGQWQAGTVAQLLARMSTQPRLVTVAKTE